jgi:hypothetical protein
MLKSKYSLNSSTGEGGKVVVVDLMVVFDVTY